MSVYRPKPGTPLTDRQRQILRLLADRRDTPAIAARLYLTVGTVNEHISHACKKLRARDRREAVAIARKAGLIDG